MPFRSNSRSADTLPSLQDKNHALSKSDGSLLSKGPEKLVISRSLPHNSPKPRMSITMDQIQKTLNDTQNEQFVNHFKQFEDSPAVRESLIPQETVHAVDDAVRSLLESFGHASPKANTSSARLVNSDSSSQTERPLRPPRPSSRNTKSFFVRSLDRKGPPPPPSSAQKDLSKVPSTRKEDEDKPPERPPPSLPLNTSGKSTQVPKGQPRVTSPTKMSKEPPRVTSPTKMSRDPPRVTSPTKMSKEPPRVTSPTKVSKDPPRVTSPTKTSKTVPRKPIFPFSKKLSATSAKKTSPPSKTSASPTSPTTPTPPTNSSTPNPLKLFPQNPTTQKPRGSIEVSANKSQGKGKAKEALVLFDFEASDENELSLKAKEKVKVLEAEHPGWWFGQVGSKTGFFPASFVLMEDENSLIAERRSKNVWVIKVEALFDYVSQSSDGIIVVHL